MPQQQTSSPGQGQRFDWWAAPAGAPRAEGPKPESAWPVPGRPAAAGPAQPAQAAPPVPSGHPVPPARLRPVAEVAEPAGDGRTEVYRAVQASEAFQEIRRGYRAFVFPAGGAFLGWYLMYVAAQAVAPAVMRSQVAGPVNVAWLLGLLQFATTFLLTWLYARNARTKRDRAALSLRWDTQDQLR
ncbi:DUF485 domain-containing protein [Kitasatospora sp. A2-31]|uniref:DUF485 domain-containing protein n=1 Tax=Kitasatospora sp. A2-31 TaxID=2916414 RepID=UPI001EEA6C77|nr:DUF485 domain-containing protein [Kitasatospora sp. A2-31]MCG6497514.1 DUF485 domain-containing protein [Kitasatospora sp. A2-31]